MPLCLLGSLRLAAADDAGCHTASAWPEADRLFRDHPHWAGADGAFSVDLGGGRTLWLFGDTWIDPTGRGQRAAATMIRNSIAIQSGLDPSRAVIDFHWRRTAQGEPGALFAAGGEEWFWPGHGLRVGDRLLVFLNRHRAVATGLGFESTGWGAVMIDNPDEAPPDWRVTSLQTPPGPLGITPGFAGVLRFQGFIYGFGTADPDKTHAVYAARWPEQRVVAGDLATPAWWAGPDDGWVTDVSSVSPRPLFPDAQSEMTIHRDDQTKDLVAIHTVGFGRASLGIRRAPGITGPWSDVSLLYHPPELSRGDVLVYAGKAHPHLTGADLILTYATNTSDIGEQIMDRSVYFPRFVRVTRCARPPVEPARRTIAVPRSGRGRSRSGSPAEAAVIRHRGSDQASFDVISPLG